MIDQLFALFPGNVVSKAWAREPELRALPRYAAEHLLVKFAPHGESTALQRLRGFLGRHCLPATAPENLQEHLARQGKAVAFARLTIRTDWEKGHLAGELSAWPDQKFSVPFEIGERFPQLFYGMWGSIRLERGERGRIVVSEFVPVRVPQARFDQFVRAREHFTEEQWMDILLQGMGTDPAGLSSEGKLACLARLAPLVERGLHLVDAPLPGTAGLEGLESFSPAALAISHPAALRSSLVANAILRTPDLGSAYEVVVLDHLQQLPWQDPNQGARAVAQLFGTLENRDGGRRVVSSVVFFVRAARRNGGAAQAPLPPWLARFSDHIAAYLNAGDVCNGALPPYSGPGLPADYLAEMFARLRPRSLQFELEEWLPRDLAYPDLRAVRRLTSGLLKLLYPGECWPADAVQKLAAFAVDVRRAVAKLTEIPQTQPATETPPGADSAQASSTRTEGAAVEREEPIPLLPPEIARSEHLPGDTHDPQSS
ncbi:MAG: hypothetical protein KatS3mg077_2041 [Candidatus Binatia bacterium]|nr:MAG: hypothetical protein KatS3mg077_2041 [Candidatus Binatia bacterium]